MSCLSIELNFETKLMNMKLFLLVFQASVYEHISRKLLKSQNREEIFRRKRNICKVHKHNAMQVHLSKCNFASKMDEMILHCNQNTVYVLNTSYTSYGEFDMIGLFGNQNACRSPSTFGNATTPTANFKSKSKATNMLLDNQINEKLKEVNNNLIKKRPHFLKLFNENFFKPGSGESESSSGSPENSSKSGKSLTRLQVNVTYNRRNVGVDFGIAI
ncbi:CLUMA_CG007530, isoform A [Clunio marinus]|uniref:CLUMA_CG007530, isoform A n=1 Tax=Clunio marinus TaxID=568069 RepID=A0A1J1I146_9DIPT|nr:CLUMA_CG007530, isoform A [Clunio marinus]